MLKKSILAIAIMLSTFSSAFAAEMKIGVYNNRLVFSKAPQVEAIQDKLNKQFADRITELKTLAEKRKTLGEKLQRDSMTMTEDQRIESGREFQQLETDLQIKQKQLQEDSKRAEQKELMAVDAIVQKAITKVAEAEGYDLILRVEAAVYAKKHIDISNKIITIISDPAG